MNAYNYYLMLNIGCKDPDSPLLYNIIRGQPPLFSHLGSRQPPLRSGWTAVGTLFQTEYPPPPPGYDHVMYINPQSVNQINIYKPTGYVPKPPAHHRLLHQFTSIYADIYICVYLSPLSLILSPHNNTRGSP